MRRLSAVSFTFLIWTCSALMPQAFAQSYEQVFPKMAETLGAAIEKAGLKNIAVVDFNDLQGQTTELGRFLAEEISTSLVLSGQSFAVIDRANFRFILQEAKLTAEGLVNPENTKKLGEIAGVDALVTGTVTPMAESVRVSVKVIATQSARIVAAHNGTITASASIQELMRRVVATAPQATAVPGNVAGGAAPGTDGSQDSGRVHSALDGKLQIKLERLGKSSRDAGRYSAFFSVKNDSNDGITLWIYSDHLDNNLLYGERGDVITARRLGAARAPLLSVPAKSQGYFELAYDGAGDSPNYRMAVVLVLDADGRQSVLSFTLEAVTNPNRAS